MTSAADIYNQGTYLAQNPGWHAADSDWKAMHVRRVLDRNHLAPKSIVEVGCGAGRVIAALATAMPEMVATGFDISRDAARLWPDASRPNLTYHLGDFTRTEARYDTLLLMDVFEHVDDYLGFLRSLRTRAGHFVFHVPLDLSAVALLTRSYMRGRADVGHLHYFTRESALATIATAGYRVRDWHYTAMSQEASRDRRTWRTRILNVPRRLVGTVAPDVAATLFGGFSMMILAEAASAAE